MTANYDGNDLEEWLNHFNFTEKIRTVLRETFEANFVDDLVYVYDDADMLNDVEKAVTRLEYKKFLDVRRRTTRIAPSHDPQSSPSSTSITTIPSNAATATTATISSPSTMTYPLPSAPPLNTLSAVPYPPHLSPFAVSPPAAPIPSAPAVITSSPDSTIDRELEAKKRELLEVERKLQEERDKHRRAAEKTKAIEKRKKMINVLEEKIRRAASLDVVFLLDCTGSMRSYIEATKTNIADFASSIHSLHPNISLRLAFIGYRDHCDKEDRLAVMRFSNSVTEFKNMVGGQVAKGGGDDAEDVLGGLHVVRGLDWESETRILYHIGDAPCHGREFHNGSSSDDYPDGDPNGLVAHEILQSLKEKRIQYFFGRIRDKTDVMIARFNELVASTPPIPYPTPSSPSIPAPYITVTPMAASGDMMTVITKSVTASFSSSLSSSARTDEGKLAKKEVVLDTTVPAFDLIPVEETLRFPMTMPASLDEMFDMINYSYSEEDKCISDFPDREHFRVKVAPSPFAKGEMRAAYFGQLITGLTTSAGIILKESLAIAPSQLTKPRYEAFLSCHRAAKALGIEFNRVKPDNCPRIEFCDACIIQFMARRNQPFMIQESQIPDEFEKYNNNSGYCAPNPTPGARTDHSAVQAFCHWTFQVSRERMMVIDCQGGYNAATRRFLLTDPAIHFVDVTRFGLTNMGRPGMAKFFETHQCNDFCRAMRLTRPST